MDFWAKSNLKIIGPLPYFAYKKMREVNFILVGHCKSVYSFSKYLLNNHSV